MTDLTMWDATTDNNMWVVEESRHEVEETTRDEEEASSSREGQAVFSNSQDESNNNAATKIKRCTPKRSKTKKKKANGYFTIVEPPKPRLRYGYQDTRRYKPSKSYHRCRLYPIQEVDEENQARQALGSENPYQKNLKKLPKPALVRNTNCLVQDHNTPAFQDFPKKAMPVVAFQEGYPIKLQGVHRRKEYFDHDPHKHHYPHTTKGGHELHVCHDDDKQQQALAAPQSYSQYVDPATTMMAGMPQQQQHGSYVHGQPHLPHQPQSRPVNQYHSSSLAQSLNQYPYSTMPSVGQSDLMNDSNAVSTAGFNFHMMNQANQAKEDYGVHLVQLCPWLAK